MGIVMGYISLLCFLLLVGKYVARKTKRDKINRFFGKLHKPISCVFLLTCVMHMCLVFPVLKARDILVTASGLIAFFIVILLILLCHIIKDGKKKMFWHRVLTIILLIIAIFHITVYIFDFMEYKEKIRAIDIRKIDVTGIADGDYIGDYDAGYIYAKVQVVVKDGKMKEIRILEHRNERGQRAESIVEHIVDKQRLDVDAVTGATNSSLVIEKACENAITQSYK